MSKEQGNMSQQQATATAVNSKPQVPQAPSIDLSKLSPQDLLDYAKARVAEEEVLEVLNCELVRKNGGWTITCPNALANLGPTESGKSFTNAKLKFVCGHTRIQLNAYTVLPKVKKTKK